MGTALLIGVAGALGCIALGLGVFVLHAPQVTNRIGLGRGGTGHEPTRNRRPTRGVKALTAEGRFIMTALEYTRTIYTLYNS
jgi:hypothetical protein